MVRLPRLAAPTALGVLTLVYLGLALGNAPRRITFPVPLSLVEPHIVVALSRLAAGEPLYRDYRAGRPVAPAPYGALEYLVPGWIARVAGLSTTAARLALGRGVSFGCGIALALLLALLAVERGVPWYLALFAGAPIAWFPYASEWFTKFTPDPPALLLSLTGFAILGRPEAPPPPTRLAAALVCWVTAFHFKPTVLVGPVGFALERLAPGRRWPDPSRLRLVACLAACLAGALAVTALLANVATAGLWKLNAIDAFAPGTFALAFLERSLGNLGRASLVLDVLGSRTPMLIGGLGVLVVMGIVAAMWAEREPLFAAFLVTLAGSLVGLARQGSNVNYFIGSFALWGLAACVAFLGRGRAAEARLPPLAALAGRRGAVTQTLLALIALLLALGVPRAGNFAFEILLPAPGEFDRVRAMTEDAPAGAVLNLDANFGVAQDVPALFADGYHAALLSRAGLVDFAPEAEAIRQQRYGLVVTNRFQARGLRYHDLPFMPDVLRQPLTEHYGVTAAGDWLVLWTPRRSAPGEAHG